MKTGDIVKRVDELLELGQEVLSTSWSDGGRYNVQHVRTAPMAGFRSAALSFIDRVYGSTHPHFVQFNEKCANDFLGDAERAMSILAAIRSEIAGGWLFTVKGLVAAELFSDFLVMSEHLLDTGYKDPAAVMVSSVLEEHLRQLCINNSIPIEEERDDRLIPRRSDRLNADLTKAEVYTKLDQKLITAWLDLRNNAAHGKYEAYSFEQVTQLLAGVTEFMARVTL